jgi:hypothetical protein
MVVRSSTFTGVEAAVPVTVYGEDTATVDRASTEAREVLTELETTYGAYAHARLVIYATKALGGGGMEYCGATTTTLPALAHELTHSWFARGVLPANGNSGWIDEAVASWRDNGYPRAEPIERSPVNLAGFSPYRRHTTRDAYTYGALFLSELDHLLARHGSSLRSVLGEFYRERRRRLITTPMFQAFVQQRIAEDLGPRFDRYVYGKWRDGTAFAAGEYQLRQEMPVIEQLTAAWGRAEFVPPPRSFTEQELAQLR